MDVKDEETAPPVIIVTSDRDVVDRAMRANPGVAFKWYRSMDHVPRATR
ncbi:hypothetical protein I0C86_41305 [Plantactinospora sp. S1510]|uniref:NYN domain-containing protein n=1 Tax=Plantactinospora alkalitolerans TaxID=2789879 RepID=A0ABS0H9Y1_9ACTN|nr:hypothetical protein [Plantactinospora alkalitolerans]MBF9135291.1 hypothetical protein [Plantactinospora alkalitolerans]